MHVHDLMLKNYRNYDDFHVGLRAGRNLIIGKNAVGKTNLLEAIYFLENGRSHRTGSYQELIHWDADFFSIKASLRREERDITVEAHAARSSGKRLTVNGVSQRGFTGRTRPIHTVLFTPDHLKVVKEMPENRRAYLDEVLEKIKGDYTYWRQQYAKVLRQRNLLLKKVAAGRMRSDIIDYWDEQLIAAGVKLIAARRGLIGMIEGYAADAYRRIVAGDAALSLAYENQLLATGPILDELAERYKEALIARRRAEIERGQTLVGPHRDDVGLFVNGVDMRTYGSQGEQRSVALALKIGELAIVSHVIKEQPVLLLDDVMSELDEGRRAALMESVADGTQTIITSTNIDYFSERDLSEVHVVIIG